MTLPVALPYGLRDIQIIPYPDLAATAFGTELVDLPNAQTFTFTETEEYTDLRGDDQLVTSHGQGAQLDGTLESGGISMEAYAALNGGIIIETGVSPNQIKRYRKRVTDQRPFFALVGKAISDSGGDLHAVVYRGRATGDIGGEFADGAFFIPSVDITGYPCNVSGDLDGEEIEDTLYDFVQHETIAEIIAPVLDVAAEPIVTGLSDNSVGTAGGELVNVYGSHFVGVTGVAVTGTAVTDYEVVTSTHIIIITPPKAAGAYNVLVTNPTGTSDVGAGNAITYA